MREPEVGDKDQRYEVSCLDGQNKYMPLGWTDDSRARGFKKCVELHPTFHDIKIVDRWEEWRKEIRKSCKQKMQNQDSSAYCVYCRKNGGSCIFENCPLRSKS